jgi:hypothetical protein
MFLTSKRASLPGSQGHSEKTIGPAWAAKAKLPAKAISLAQMSWIDILADLAIQGRLTRIRLAGITVIPATCAIFVSIDTFA